MRPVLFSILFLLIACGGGGGGGGGGGSTSPTMQPPPVMQPEPDQATITFTRDLNSGLRRVFGTDFNSDQERQSGGVAAADFDNDGDVDLLVVGGNTEPNHLYANQGDGTFVEIAADVGLDFVNWASGPAFGDIDGDADLFIGAIDDTIFLLENRLDDVEAGFVDITAGSGIIVDNDFRDVL